MFSQKYDIYLYYNNKNMQNYDLKSLFPTYSVIEGLESKYPMFDNIIQNKIDMKAKMDALEIDIKGRNDNNDILDENGNLKTTGRLVDVARQDVQNILVQQNTLYMVGTITIATLLITAILISKK
jgi:hypothetical protein